MSDRNVSDQATPGGILETVVYADDLDAALQFYQQVVGLELVSSEPGRHHFFRIGDSMLLVFNPQSTAKETVQIGEATIPKHGSRGESHFAFQVQPDQFAAIRANLAAHSVEVESEIDWPGGGHSLYCRDPAGNSVEFATRSLWFEE